MGAFQARARVLEAGQVGLVGGKFKELCRVPLLDSWVHGGHARVSMEDPSSPQPAEEDGVAGDVESRAWATRDDSTMESSREEKTSPVTSAKMTFPRRQSPVRRFRDVSTSRDM